MLSKKYIIGNWKMNKNSKEVDDFLNKFHFKFHSKNNNLLVGLSPAAIHLEKLNSHAICYDNIVFSVAQNISSKDNGAFTGEMSASMVADYVNYVLVGHSERREHFHENNNVLLKKIKQCYSSNLIPIFCFGEKLDGRKKGDYLLILKNQLLDILDLLLNSNIIDDVKVNFILAYEPVWAIGTGNSATIDQIIEVHDFIRSILINYFNKKGENIPILYGGSCNSKNAKSILSQKNVGGLLIGGASLNYDHFIDIINQANEVC